MITLGSLCVLFGLLLVLGSAGGQMAVRRSMWRDRKRRAEERLQEWARREWPDAS